MVEQTTKLVEIDQQIVEAAVQSAVQDRSIIREDVDGEPWLYLASLHRAEVGLAKSVFRIASHRPHPLPPIDVEKAIAWVEQRLNIQLALGQREAVRQACQHKLLVITGGPGVGKTTLVLCHVKKLGLRKAVKVFNMCDNQGGLSRWKRSISFV